MSKNFVLVRRLVVSLALGAMSLGSAADSLASDNTGGEDTELSFSTGKNSSNVVVKALNLKASAASSILIKNSYGRTIYTETLSTGKDYQKRYEFSKLKPGRYTLVLETATEAMSKPFVVGMSGAVREDYRSAFENFAPLYVENEAQQSVKVTFMNPSPESLRVSMTNRKGRVLYSETVAGNQAYAKVINMKKLRPSEYRINIENNDYAHTINVLR